MMEVSVIALRWLQYSGAVVLFGAPLFLLYSFRGTDGPAPGWARPALWIAAFTVGFGALAGLVVQTAVMAGSLSEAVKPATLSFMITGSALGMAMLARAALALLALVALVILKPGRMLWRLMVGVGLPVAASFAWTGHGAASEGMGGLVHLTADIVHTVAAALWLGALGALILLLTRRAAPQDAALHRALQGFAGVGTLAVALLVLTGLANSWFLIGLEGVGALARGLYGQLLIAKLILFTLMLGLAADNRFRLTPALGAVVQAGEDPRSPLRKLRHSILAETVTGAVLLGLVAVMGTLAPPAAL